jgi:hypothetical protein
VYASGVALGDVVGTQRRGDAEWATNVVSDAGNWCARVVPFRPLEAPFVECRLAAFECTLWITRIGLVVVEVDASAPTDPLLEELIRGREENVWDFDEEDGSCRIRHHCRHVSHSGTRPRGGGPTPSRRCGRRGLDDRRLAGSCLNWGWPALPGADVEIDPFVDDAGVVFVHWRASDELVEGFAAPLLAQEFDGSSQSGV